MDIAMLLRVLIVLLSIPLAVFSYKFAVSYYKKLNKIWSAVIATFIIFGFVQAINIFYELIFDSIIFLIVFAVFGYIIFRQVKTEFAGKLIPESWRNTILFICSLGMAYLLTAFYGVFLLLVIAIQILLMKSFMKLKVEWTTERARTGIEKLDALMYGGIPPKSNVMIYGPPGAGKSTLCRSFIIEGLMRDQQCLYVAIDEDPSEVKEAIKKFVPIKNLTIIDCYSSKHNTKSKEKYTSALDLDNLSIVLTSVLGELKNGEKRCVIDSASSLSLVSDPSMFIKFIQNTSNKLRDADFTSLFVIEEGTLDQKTLATVRYTLDGEIVLSREGSKKYVHVAKLKGTKISPDIWEYKISDRGITLVKKYEEEIEI